MRSLLNVSLITLAGVFLSVGNMIGQSNGETPVVNITPRPRSAIGNTVTEPRANIRVDTTLVPIPVSVMDPLRRFVTGLDKEDFKVYEDRVEQEINYLSNEDAPVSVGIVFDTSGSMGEKLSSSRQAVAQFMKTASICLPV